VRVLLLATPLTDAWMRNGSTRAVVDLARALADRGVRPMVLVREGFAAPEGCSPISVGRFGVLPAVVGARPDVIHAMFVPRPQTSLALATIARATRARVVQTVASVPARYTAIRHALFGEAVVATSKSTERELLAHGVDRARLHLIPMPFANPGAVASDVTKKNPRFAILFGGDYEFGDSLAVTLRAFSQMSAPHGVVPELVIAARDKTRRAKVIAKEIGRTLMRPSAHRDRVRLLGHVPSLLPEILAARLVVLPASSTYAKLDHPRVLLEAIALGTRIVVGTAPSLAELVTDPTIGEVVDSVSTLREAMERSFDSPLRPREDAIVDVLAPRRPDVVAERYAALYAGSSGIRSRPSSS